MVAELRNLARAAARRRQRHGGDGQLGGAYGGETYYDRPAVKPSLYGWRVAAYIFTAGLAGGAQIIATIADLLGGRAARGIVGRGRSLAFSGTVAGPLLLIADLHTPQRFLNMLRIFRRTSPMSLGSYILSAFGLFSGVTYLAQLLGFRRTARLAQIPAAVAGAGMTSYTAALLGATSTPLWAATPASLGVRFASSAVASAAAALSMGARAEGNGETARALDGIAMAATGVELAATVAESAEARRKGVDGALRQAPWGTLHKTGVVALGMALPLALYALSRRQGRNADRLSTLASLGVLAGSMLMRSVTLHAGNESATRPHDYFRLTEGGRPH